MYQVFLLVLLVIASAQLDCPNPAIECVVDPCEGAICPRFLTADCEANLCHGLCTANFNWRGSNVTDRCAVRRCVDKKCPGVRVCVEEVTPSSCSDDKPKCRQYLNVRCVLPPPITDCNQLQCPEGMVCRKRIRGDNVVCVIARDCSQLECDEGFACVVLDRRAQCRALPTTSSPPITDTPTISEITSSGDTSSAVTPSSEITSSGDTSSAVTSSSEITSSGDMSSPVTPSPSVCMQLGCEVLRFLCEVEEGIPACVLPAGCIPIAIRLDFCVQLVCEEKNGMSQCMIPSSCDQFVNECPRGKKCSKPFGLAVCESVFVAESCAELDCETIGQVCEQVNETFAMCVQPTSCTEALEELCRESGSVCGVLNGTAICHPPETCEQLVNECPLQQGCILRVNSDLTPSGNVAFCSFFHPSCETLTCNETSLCLSQGYPSVDLFLSACVIPSIADVLRALIPCTEQNFCDPHTELCVDSRLKSGNFVRSVCIRTNCNDENNCSFDEVCLVVPPSTGIPVTSACVPVDGAFEFGPSCSTSSRECPNGTVCSNVDTDEQVVGTICDFDPRDAPPFSTSCETLDCEAAFPRGECFLQSVDSGESVASCTSVESTTLFIETVRNTFGLSLSCDQFVCPHGTICTEEIGSTAGSPVCEPLTTAVSCAELDCETIGQVCEQVNETFAMCVQPTSCTEALEELCRESGDVCAVLNGTAICHPPETCEQLVNECPLQQGCILRRSSLTPSGHTATCSFATPSCKTLNCNERSVCLNQGFPSLDLFFSFCFDVDIFRGSVPCTERNFCNPGAEVCVDSRRQNGDYVRSYCLDIDCYSSDDSGSSSGSTSGESISKISSADIFIASKCFLSVLDFELGSNCATNERKCPFGSVCNNIEIEGQVVGTTCDDDDPIVTSCDALDCKGDGSSSSSVGALSSGGSSSSGGSLSSGESSIGLSSGGDCFQGLIDDNINYMATCISEGETTIFVRAIRAIFDL